MQVHEGRRPRRPWPEREHYGCIYSCVFMRHKHALPQQRASQRKSHKKPGAVAGENKCGGSDRSVLPV